MLNVKRISLKGAGAGAYSKYITNKQESHTSHTGDEYVTGYYSKGAPSEWHGKLAERIGLSGSVDTKTLQDLLEGEMPDGTSFAGKRHDRRAANDISLSAPKSVSIAALAGGDERIIAAHDAAVKKAMDYNEAEVISARYGKGGYESVKTGAGVCALFRHEDARPVDGYVDPQLHTHGVWINVTVGKDGKLRNTDLDFGKDAVRMHTADAVYKAELAKSMIELGYDIRKTKDGFELAHISDDQIAEFSKRKIKIDQELESKGLARETSTPDQRNRANLATRSSKGDKQKEDLMYEWRNRAREAGIDLSMTKKATQRAESMSKKEGKSEKAKLADDAVKFALRDLSERKSVLSREEVTLESIKAGMGKVSLDDIKEALKNRSDIYSISNDKIVTKDTLLRESRIINSALNSKAATDAIMDADVVGDVIAKKEVQQGFKFSDGQRQALEMTLTNTDQVCGIVGAAGAGKTTAMAVLVEQAKKAGFDTVGIAPSAAAAKELEASGAEDCRTIASFNLQKQESTNPRLIILDEAGMCSARDIEKVLKKLGPGDKLTLVGDPKQLAAVEAGSPFKMLMDEKAIKYAEIMEINRQKNPELLAIAQDFAKGKAGEAVDKAEKFTREVNIKDADWSAAGIDKDEWTKKKGVGSDGEVKTVPAVVKKQAIARETADKYLRLSKEDRKETLTLAATNETRSLINEKIRDGLKEAGDIGKEQCQVTSLKKGNLTRAQMTQAQNYDVGQIMRMTTGKGKNAQTEDYEIVGVDTEKNTLKTRAKSDHKELTVDLNKENQNLGRLYTPKTIELSVGDKVVALENDKSSKLTNGMLLNVKSIDGDKIKLVDSKDRVFEIDKNKSHTLDYGYALTIHKSQGQTVNSVIVAGEGSRTATAELAYVACSRERHNLEIITDSAESLKSSWKTYADREGARESMNISSMDEARSEIRHEQERQLRMEKEFHDELERQLAREHQKVR